MKLPAKTSPATPPFLASRPAARALAVAALCAVALLPACSVLPKAEPVDTYLLPAAALAPAGGATLPLSLRVSRPAAGTQLSGQRIAVVPEDGRVSVYKGASWSEPAPVLLRNRLLDAFRADGRIAALSSDDTVLQADVEIDSDLRGFQAEYRNGAVEAVIRLEARLVQVGTRRILASRGFEVREPAAGSAVPQVVQAFGGAGDRLAAQVVAWAVQAAAAPNRGSVQQP